MLRFQYVLCGLRLVSCYHVINSCNTLFFVPGAHQKIEIIHRMIFSFAFTMYLFIIMIFHTTCTFHFFFLAQIAYAAVFVPTAHTVTKTQSARQAETAYGTVTSWLPLSTHFSANPNCESRVFHKNTIDSFDEILVA